MVFYKTDCFSCEAGECSHFCSHRHQGLPGIRRQDGSKFLVDSMLAPADLYCLFLARDQPCADFG